MSERSAILLLEDILISADKIIRYTANVSYSQFLADDKTMDAVIRNFEIIGEAAHRLPDDVKERFMSVEWFRIRGFRNRIVHDYMGVNYAIVWNIIETYLPTLIQEIKLIIAQID